MTKTPLEFVSIYIKETATSFTTDSVGSFLIDQLCGKATTFHLAISAMKIGDMFISLWYQIQQLLSFRSRLSCVGEVEATASNEKRLQNSQNINAQYLNQNSNQNLSGITSNIFRV